MCHLIIIYILQIKPNRDGLLINPLYCDKNSMFTLVILLLNESSLRKKIFGTKINFQKMPEIKKN